MSHQLKNNEENTGSRSSSIERMTQRSLENIPSLLNESKNTCEVKHSEKREQLSDMVSKFYFQKQTDFANQHEAYDLGNFQINKI